MQDFSGETLNDEDIDDHPWIDNLRIIPMAYGAFFALQPEGLKPMCHLRCIVAGRLGERILRLSLPPGSTEGERPV
jgi:hypothetical protein